MNSALRWIPAFLLMITMFILSSTPAEEMPSFCFWDSLVKKGGHSIGYGFLALFYIYGMRWIPRRYLLAFLLSVLFALMDELHQAFVPGRHASLVDAMGFDAGGAIFVLGVIWCRNTSRKRSFEFDL